MTTIEDLLKWDAAHLVHAYLPIGENRGKMFDKAKGVILQDTDGKEYIDFSSHVTCINLGYGQSELVAAAAEQMQKLAYSTIFFGFSHRPSIECGMKLAELTPEGLDHFLFATGGSTSTEQASRLARLYWSNKGLSKHKIIALYGSWHGQTPGALSATGVGKDFFWKGVAPAVPGFIHIPPYYCYRCMFGKEYPQCGIQCAKHLAEVIEQEGPGTVAAFIAEPVIGAGGMIPPPPEYWPMVREICTNLDVLLITDEVMTGFCRTGKMFAVEHWGIKPDIMTVAKGITSAYFPLGAVVFNARVYQGVKGVVTSGFTYDGHPVGCAIATKAMEIYVRDKIAEKVAKASKHLMDRLTAEFLPLPCVGDITGLGLMGGIEIVADKTTKKVFAPELRVMERIRNQALENGLYIRAASINMALSDRIQWSPPLTITIEEVDRALDILRPIIADL